MFIQAFLSLFTLMHFSVSSFRVSTWWSFLECFPFLTFTFVNSLKVLLSGGGIPETSTNEGYPGLYKSGEYTGVVGANSTQKIIFLSSVLQSNYYEKNFITDFNIEFYKL